LKIHIYILLLIGSLILVQTNVNAEKIIVDKKSTLNSILKAVKTAKPYDEIIINQGFYSEGNIIIDKPLRITGINEPIIDGDSKHEIFTVHSNDVIISGIIFKNAGINYLKENAAVRFENVKGCEVSNCKFYGNFFGVYLAKSSYCRVLNNYMEAYGKKEASSGNGIHLWNSREIEVKGNKIRGHRDGIYLEFARQTLITGNYSTKNLRYGLHFMFSDSCKYYSNQFEFNSAGVAVMYSHFVEMKNNKFNNNWGPASYGLLLKDITDSKITDNKFIENTSGIYIEGCNRSEFEKNLFEKNGWAVKLMANSSDNLFTMNNFVSNTFDVSTNSRQNFSTFSSNYWSKYEGYDLDKNGIGDVPYRPVKLYSVLVEKNEPSLILLNSLFIEILNIAESVFPSITPETLVDDTPLLRKIK
jgi:nitrous oxidase accessory protein